MVLAAVVLGSKAARQLSRTGLRDSKSFGSGDKARRRRSELAEQVRNLAHWTAVEIVDVTEVDKRVHRGELNVLEREVATRLIENSPAVDRIVADGKLLFAPLRVNYPLLEAYNDGESRHAAVAAASILAKTKRDSLFDCIANRYAPAFGELRGGGYVNSATRRFLIAYAERFGKLPPEARKSWPYSYLESSLKPRIKDKK